MEHTAKKPRESSLGMSLVNSYTHSHTCARAHTHMHACACTHIYTHTRASARTHTHTKKHAHISYEWVMSRIWMRHVTHTHGSCHAYEWVEYHIWKSDPEWGIGDTAYISVCVCVCQLVSPVKESCYCVWVGGDYKTHLHVSDRRYSLCKCVCVCVSVGTSYENVILNEG